MATRHQLLNQLTPAHNIQGIDITEAVGLALRYHVDLPNPDASLSIETHLINVRIASLKSGYDFDLGKQLWLNKGRWTRLIREYVAAYNVDLFIDQAKTILSGEARAGATAGMMFRDPKRSAKKHRWGGCLMAATFNAAPHPTLTFFSRTTYLGYMGIMDAAIAGLIAKRIAKPHEIRFQWHIASCQFHAFKSLPFLYTQADLVKRLDRYKEDIDAAKAASPTWYYLAKWQQRIERDYKQYGVKMMDVEKYGPFKRVKRRWMEYKGILTKRIPPSLKIDQLDFSAAE